MEARSCFLANVRKREEEFQQNSPAELWVPPPKAKPGAEEDSPLEAPKLTAPPLMKGLGPADCEAPNWTAVFAGPANAQILYFDSCITSQAIRPGDST